MLQEGGYNLADWEEKDEGNKEDEEVEEIDSDDN